MIDFSTFKRDRALFVEQGLGKTAAVIAAGNFASFAQYQTHWARLDVAARGGAFIADDGRIVARRQVMPDALEVTRRLGGTTDADLRERAREECANGEP